MPIALVATHGRESSAGALRLAASWADRHGAEVELVTVDHESSRRDVRTLLEDVFDAPPMWPHTVISGDVASGLARMSAERSASLLLMGCGAATIDTARQSGIPILAVPTSTTRLPHHAVLAIDLSASSLRAANVAIQLLSRPAVAQIVTIAKPAEDIELLLDVMEDSLRCYDGVELGRYCGTGEPAAEVLRFAATQRADLIAVGRCGQSQKPCRIGHVARAIISGASCGVLVV